MKKIAFIFALLLPIMASAGVYDDMEEAIIRGDSFDAIAVLKRGLDVNSVDRNGDTLLIQGVRRNMPEFIDYLVKRRARLNLRNKNGESALSIASFTGQLPLVKLLVEAGADVNLYGWPPLSYAAYNGHLAVADYLIKRGAEVNAKAANGGTALFFAARFGHEAVVELLLKNGADPTVTDEYGETAIDWALKGKNTDIADKIRAAGGRSGKTVVLEF